MSKRFLDENLYTPADLGILSRAFDRACTECALTGAAGRAVLAKTLLIRFKNGVTREEDLVDVARIFVWRRRGLGPGLHLV